MEPRLPAVEMQRFSHWTVRGVPIFTSSNLALPSFPVNKNLGLQLKPQKVTFAESGPRGSSRSFAAPSDGITGCPTPMT